MNNETEPDAFDPYVYSHGLEPYASHRDAAEELADGLATMLDWLRSYVVRTQDSGNRDLLPEWRSMAKDMAKRLDRYSVTG